MGVYAAATCSVSWSSVATPVSPLDECWIEPQAADSNDADAMILMLDDSIDNNEM